MLKFGEDYGRRLRGNKNQLFRDFKPKERICKIVTEHIQANISTNKFKFIKSRMQLERTVGDFKQAVWFRTSIKNFRDEVVNFQVHLKVENKEYLKHCIEKYDLEKKPFISIQVQYLDLWDKEFCEGWYSLHLDDNMKIALKIADNISNCSTTFLDANSNYETSLKYRFQQFKNSEFFASLLIPDILILSELTNNQDIKEITLRYYEDWKLTEDGKQRIENGADVFTIIEKIKNLL